MASGGRRRKPRAGSARPKHKKRTKYLSLSRIIVKAEVHTHPEDDGDSPEPSPPPSPAPLEEGQPEVKHEEDCGVGHQHPQADPPFALLHHEASTLFAALPAPSLSDILGASAGGGGSDGSPSPSASPAGLTGAEEEDLARRALRGRERWVYCCSSASSPSTTSASSPCSSAASTGASARGSLLLKLDYDEILAAWADRGSLYIAHAAPKKEEPDPDLENVLVEVEPPPPQQQQHPAVKVESPPQPLAACAWTTPPETAGCGRADSVRRYREKRRNRLFAHRIRYEIRRANAVKRPRFKGRFIKHEEIEV